MSQKDNRREETDTADPRGQTAPPGGRDRSHDPRKQTPHTPGGGAKTREAGQGDLQPSEEASNQSGTSNKSRAESGTP
jgi:hypothetical protein